MSPVREIWFNTGNCFNYFLEKENQKNYLFEFVWVGALNIGLYHYLNDRSSLFGFSLILLPVIYVLILRYFTPWLLFKTGKLVNGKGTLNDLRLVVSLSCIPSALSFLFYLLEFIVAENAPFNLEVIQIILYIFYLRIFVIGVAKVQKLTYISAWMNILIPGIVITVLYLVIFGY